MADEADVTLARASACPANQHHSAAAPRLNRAIVAWVVKAGPCSLEQLDEIFGPAPDTPNLRLAQEHFRDRLARLVAVGQLAHNGQRDARRLWRAGPLAPALPAPPAAPRWAGPIVPPRRVDVMGGPVYVPPPAAPVRAGATDFQRCASLGVRC